MSPLSSNARVELGFVAAFRIAEAVASLPARSIVIDGELTACDGRGLSNFRSLHFGVRTDVLCVWAFDRPYLTAGKRMLEKIVNCQ